MAPVFPAKTLLAPFCSESCTPQAWPKDPGSRTRASHSPWGGRALTLLQAFPQGPPLPGRSPQSVWPRAGPGGHTAVTGGDDLTTLSYKLGGEPRAPPGWREPRERHALPPPGALTHNRHMALGPLHGSSLQLWDQSPCFPVQPDPPHLRASSSAESRA